MFPRGLAAAGAILASFAFAASAGAQTGTDPGAGSPAGQVYELPLERGRSDAAPAPRDGGAPDRSEGSVYRSENNFGSSSQVPGVERRARAAAEPEKVLASGAPAELPTGEGDDGGDPSILRTLALVAMIALVGVIGFVARRSWSS